MDRPTQYFSSEFKKVKKDLDPAFSYVVIERSDVSSNDDSFTDVLDTLTFLRKHDIQWRVYKGETERLRWLVIKLLPAHAEEVMQEILSAGLKKEMKYYFYGSSQ
jgi:hypothetical protein